MWQAELGRSNVNKISSEKAGDRRGEAGEGDSDEEAEKKKHFSILFEEEAPKWEPA